MEQNTMTAVGAASGGLRYPNKKISRRTGYGPELFGHFLKRGSEKVLKTPRGLDLYRITEYGVSPKAALPAVCYSSACSSNPFLEFRFLPAETGSPGESLVRHVSPPVPVRL